jgi:hypothetical protein
LCVCVCIAHEEIVLFLCIVSECLCVCIARAEIVLLL